MEIERIVNAQEALIEIFPDLTSALTVTMAQNSLTWIESGRKNGFDPYPNVFGAIQALAPKAYAPILNYQAAALYVMEADSLWLRALGEAPATGDER